MVVTDTDLMLQGCQTSDIALSSVPRGKHLDYSYTTYNAAHGHLCEIFLCCTPFYYFHLNLGVE